MVHYLRHNSCIYSRRLNIYLYDIIAVIGCEISTTVQNIILFTIFIEFILNAS